MSSFESSLDKICRFVARIVEGRDPDLASHNHRLGNASELFAQHVSCTPEEITLISIGACIHDIGKLAISEHILNKPARLTAAEFSLVKQHTEIGSRLLEPLEVDPRISQIVQHHHENYDGSGYPHGLSGEAIPYLARIVRICDTFDALTEDRPYHQGVSVDKALLVLKRDARFYDPTLLNAFCKMMGI